MSFDYHDATKRNVLLVICLIASATGSYAQQTSATVTAAQSHLDDGLPAPGTRMSTEPTAVSIPIPNYSATRSYSYFSSTVGNCDPQKLFNEYQYIGFWTSSGVFCATGPTNNPSAAYNQTAGVMGFAHTLGVGSGTGTPRAVGGYFQGTAIGNGSSAFGINPANGDIASTFQGTISGTTLTVSTINSGPQSSPGTFAGIMVGQTLFGAGITGSPTITAAGTGTGGKGTYTITNPNSLTLSSQTISSQFTGELLPTQENDTEVYGAFKNFANSGANITGLALDLYNFGPGGIAGPAVYVSSFNEHGSTGTGQWAHFAKINVAAIAQTVLNVNPVANANSSNNSSSPPLFDTYTQYWNGTGGSYSGFTGLQAVSGSGTNPAWDELLTTHNVGSTKGPAGQAHYFTIGNSMAYAIQHSDAASSNNSVDIIAGSSARGGPVTYTLPGTSGMFMVGLTTTGSGGPTFANGVLNIPSKSGGNGTESKAGASGTTTTCSSGASPAVCSGAAVGAVAIPTGTNPTLTVKTTAVTATSQIFLQSDDSLAISGITCNSTLASLVGGTAITGRSSGASFTITFNGTLARNPLCLSYHIINE